MTAPDPRILPVSAVVATRNRPAAFAVTLASLREQEVFPAELVVVDASDTGATRDLVEGFARTVPAACSVRWLEAKERGAAAQRNQGVAAATQPALWFFDDDIRFEPEAITRLWRALSSDPRVGAANAMIVNQRYLAPRAASALMFRLLHGRRESTYAGRVIGPAVNLLPEDRPDLPDIVPTQWLNSTCTMYRREALPVPPFPGHFTGYSMFEDASLSLVIGRNWRLVNARTARIHHDSQPGDHKCNPAALAEMELVNRHYVMTAILGRRGPSDYLRLAAWEAFGVASSLRVGAGWRNLPADLTGKARAIRRLLTNGNP